MASSISLTDDILIEIFSFLPLNSIYKFKCLSKVWLFNLSSHNSNFIIKWFQINNKWLPWIQYQLITNCGSDDEYPWRFRIAYPDLYSEFMSKNKHLFSFEFLTNGKQFQGAKLYLLGSSNGLVLCQAVHLDGQERYHVCNPLTKTWVSLPSPPGSPLNSNYVHVSGIFCEHSSSFTSCYKVVHVPGYYEPTKKFDAYIFSSDLGVWESFRVSCDEYVLLGHSTHSTQPNAVIRNGVLFCIDKWNRMLVYNLNQNSGSDEHRCVLINLPVAGFVNYSDGILGESDGWVCCARTRFTGKKLSVSVWVLDEFNWQILHKDISVGGILAEMLSRMGEIRNIQVLGFSPVDRNVVLLGCMHRIWGFNLQTRNFEEFRLDGRHEYNKSMSVQKQNRVIKTQNPLLNGQVYLLK